MEATCSFRVPGKSSVRFRSCPPYPPDNLGLIPLPSDVIDKLEQSYKSRAEAKTTLVHRLPEVKELVAKQMKIIAACASARELARS